MYTFFKPAVLLLCLHITTSCSPTGTNLAGANELYGRPAPGQDGSYGPYGPKGELHSGCRTEPVRSSGIRGPRGARGQAVARGLPGVRCPPEDDNRGAPSDGPKGGRQSEPHSGCRTERVRSSGIRGPRGARGQAIARGLPGVLCPPEDDNRGAPSDNRVVPDNSVNPTALRFQRLLKSGASVNVIFGELDSDKNGYVTRYEWLAKGGDTTTFLGLLERFDANDDAQFDMREARLVWSDNQIEDEGETNEDPGLPAPDRRTYQKGPYRYIGPQN